MTRSRHFLRPEPPDLHWQLAPIYLRMQQRLKGAAQRAIDNAALDLHWRICPPVLPNRLMGATINHEGDAV